MKNKMRYFWVLVLFILVTLSCTKTSSEEVFEKNVSTEIGSKLAENCEEIARIFSDTTFVVAKGVECSKVHFQVMSGFVVHAHLIKVDLNEPGVVLSVAMPNDEDNYSGVWKKQTLTDMASFHDKKGARVVAMTNGDFWDTSVTKPRGPIHRNGNVLTDDFFYLERVPQQAISYIAIDNKGDLLIADSLEYAANASKYKEVTGSGVVMLKNGEIANINKNWIKARDPRTALGYTADGVVYMLTADGRATLYSDGMTYVEMGSLFKALGCVNAANLDGGGSAQMLIRNPVSLGWQIRNRPSDGKERAVINGWMVTVNEN